MPHIGTMPQGWPDTRGQVVAQQVSELVQIIQQAKQKRRVEQQISNILSLISQGKTGPELAGGLQMPQKTGLGGILDLINPMTPARTGTSAIEDLILRQAIYRPRHTADEKPFPHGLTGPQLEALPYTEQEWRGMKRRKKVRSVEKPPKVRKKAEEEYIANIPPEERLEDKANYAIAEPDEATEAYREALYSLGYGDEDLEKLRQIFKEGDIEKVKEAIKRIGIY